MSLATKLFDLLGLKKTEQIPFWLKITTKVPGCIYYFGPFDSPYEAKSSQAGYIEDLMKEGALGIHIELEQHWQLEALTICKEELF